MDNYYLKYKKYKTKYLNLQYGGNILKDNVNMSAFTENLKKERDLELAKIKNKNKNTNVSPILPDIYYTIKEQVNILKDYANTYNFLLIKKHIESIYANMQKTITQKVYHEIETELNIIEQIAQEQHIPIIKTLVWIKANMPELKPKY